MREKSSTKHLVEFFNASPGEEYYWMASADNHLLFKSDPHMLDDNSSLLKKNTDLKDAIKQAKRVCGIDNTSSSSGSNLKRKTSPAVSSSSSNATTTTATTNNDNTSSEGVAPTENLEPKTKKVKSSSSNITPPPQSPFHNRSSSSSSSSPISSSSNNNNTTKVTLTDDELSKVLTQLDKAIEDKNSDNIKDFIDFIHDNCNEITVEQLKKIKIGKCVHKLRKSEDEQVAMKAKDLVKIWTAKVTGSSNSSGAIKPTTTPTTTPSAIPSAIPSTTPSTTTTPTPTPTPTPSTTTPTTPSTTTPSTTTTTTPSTTTPSTTTTTEKKRASTPTTTTTLKKATFATTTATTTTTQQQVIKSPSTKVKPISTTTTTATTKSSSSTQPPPPPQPSTTYKSTSPHPLTPVTPTIDASKIPQDKDENRNRWRSKFAQGLILVKDADESKVIEMCVDIENEVFNYFKSPAALHIQHTYEDQCRTLSRNLSQAKNEDFRTDVYNGKFSIKQIPTLKVQDMASKERQKERQILQEKKQLESMAAKPLEVESSMFRCWCWCWCWCCCC